MRTYILIAILLLVTAMYSIAVMAHMLLFRDKAVFFLYARWWAKALLKLCRIQVNVVGLEHITPGIRCVYVSNHASLFDIPIVLASIPDNIRIMYKKELRKIPIFGWCVRMGPYIPVTRERSREASSTIGAVVESMAGGSSVLVFPEGTRSANGELREFKRGAFAIALQSGKPIVPVSIAGSQEILPARSKKLQPGNVTVTIHQAMPAVTFGSRQEELEHISSVRSTIQSGLTL